MEAFELYSILVVVVVVVGIGALMLMNL